MVLLCLLGCIAGALLPVQTSINTGLRKAVGSIYIASLISFSISALIFFFLLLCTGQLYIPFQKMFQEPFWVWLGGVFGILYLMECILLFPRIGASRTVMLPALGQILMGMVIDQFGIFGTPKTSISALRIVGTGLVLIGIVIFSGQKTDTGETMHMKKRVLWGLSILGVIGGALSASQSAVNGYVGRLTGSVFRATLISCVVGVSLMIVICLVVKARSGLEFQFPPKGPWWVWLGGFIGGFFVAVNTLLAPVVGVGLTAVLGQAGSIGSGLVVDHFGILGAKQSRMNRIKGISVTIIVIGIILIRLL